MEEKFKGVSSTMELPYHVAAQHGQSDHSGVIIYERLTHSRIERNRSFIRGFIRGRGIPTLGDVVPFAQGGL